MQRARLVLISGAAAVGVAGSVAFAATATATGGASQPAAASSNGAIATTEYFNHGKNPVEQVTISAFHWGNVKQVSYTLIDYKTKAVVQTGSVATPGGAGEAVIQSLPGGTYQLQFNHIDSTPDTVTFGVDCDKTC